MNSKKLFVDWFFFVGMIICPVLDIISSYCDPLTWITYLIFPKTDITRN